MAAACSGALTMAAAAAAHAAAAAAAFVAVVVFDASSASSNTTCLGSAWHNVAIVLDFSVASIWGCFKSHQKGRLSDAWCPRSR